MRASLQGNFDRAAALADWSWLYARAKPNFFQSPAFVAAWLESAGADAGLLRVEDEGATVGLALVGGKRVRWFGETGRPDFDRLYVEDQDVLLPDQIPGADAVRDAALEALVDGSPDAPEFVVRNARPALREACERLAGRRGFALRILRSQATFVVDLSQAEDSFSSSLRAKIRRSLRRYEERGPMRIVRAETTGERAAAFADLMALHEAYWSERGEQGAFANPELRAFHEHLIATSPDACELLRVTAGETTVGVLYNFIAGCRVYNYQSGFRAEDDNQLAPGFTAHALAIGHYRSRAFSVYDLMAGDADYKRRLGREGETLTSLVIERRSVLQRAKALARRFRSAGTRRT